MYPTEATPAEFNPNTPYGSSAGWWHDRGFKPIPLKPGTKLPVVKWTQYREHLDKEQVLTWIARYPTSNVGLICTGLVVVDVDVKPRPGGGARYEGESSLETMIAAGLDLTDAPQVNTPSGGRHIYYRSLHQTDRQSYLRGIDLKAAGYVVAPPSKVDSGQYRFAGSIDLSAFEQGNLPESTYLNEILADAISKDSRTPTWDADGEESEASSEDIALFDALFEKLGVYLRTGEHNYKCPWHEDRHASLSVHRERTIFNCHGCNHHGNLRTLGGFGSNGREKLALCSRGGLSPVRANREYFASRALSKLAPLDQEPMCLKPIWLYTQHKASGDYWFWNRNCMLYTCEECGPWRIELESETWAAKFEGRTVCICYLPPVWANWRNWRHRACDNNWLWGRLPGDSRSFVVSETVIGLPFEMMDFKFGGGRYFDPLILKRRIGEALEEYNLAWPPEDGRARRMRKSGPAFKGERKAPNPDFFSMSVSDPGRAKEVLAQASISNEFGTRDWVKQMLNAGINVPDEYMRPRGGHRWAGGE